MINPLKWEKSHLNRNSFAYQYVTSITYNVAYFLLNRYVLLYTDKCSEVLNHQSFPTHHNHLNRLGTIDLSHFTSSGGKSLWKKML